MNPSKTSGLSLLLLQLLLLTGCATRHHNPLDLTRVDSSATPSQVRQNFEQYRGRTVQWGGLIVDRSGGGSPPLLEILSYPLDNDGNPDEYRIPTGLFRFRFTGPLDLPSHQPGRFVTVVAKIAELTPADGGAQTQPQPQVTGDQLHLWEWRSRDDHRPRTTFGLGLGMHF